jgi:hypothetical protein
MPMPIMPDDNFIVLKGWMINKLGLSGTALIIYAVIFGFSQDGKSCFRGSIAYLAACAGVSDRAVQKILQQLIKKGFIEKVETQKVGRQYNDYRVIDPEKAIKQAQKKAEQAPQMGEQSSQMGEQSSPHINNINITKDHKEIFAEQVGETSKFDEPKDKPDLAGVSPPRSKKPSLLEREPENDMERVEKQWQLNYLDLFGRLPIDPAWGAIRGRLKRLFKTVSVENILLALEEAKKDPWIANGGYSLLKILAGDQLSKLLHTHVKGSSGKNAEAEYDEWLNFGRKG